MRRSIIKPIISEYSSMRFQKKPTISLKTLISVWLVGDSYFMIALILSRSADTSSWLILKSRYFNSFRVKAYFSILTFNPASCKA